MTRERFAYLGLYAALSLFFCWPLFAQPLAGGTGDWDQQTFFYASYLRSVAAGQMPFWNPWYCGGNVLWQNPQVSLVSPVYLLALVMPLALAMKINVFAHYVAACLGMHLLVRRIAGVRDPSIVIYCVSLFVFAGGMALHTRSGHVNFLPVFLLPALVYFFFRAAEGQTRFVIAGGAVIAFAVLNGGSHVVPLGAVLLGAFGLGALAVGRTLRPLVVAVGIVIAGCAYAAPKLIPVSQFITSPEFQDRRPVKHPDFMTGEMVVRALADGSQGTDLKVGPAQKYAWHEYGNYMGWFGGVLAFGALVKSLGSSLKKDRWREGAAAVGLVVAVLFAAGEFASWAPATLIRSLPGFSSFRIPSRYVLLIPLAGALCIAFVAKVRQGSRWRYFVQIVCVVGVLQLVIVNREAYRDVFVMPPVTAPLTSATAPTIAPNEPESARLSRLGENSNFIRSMAEGVSALNCYEQLIVRRIATPGPADLHGEAATISSRTFSPSRISAVATTGNEPGRVVLNQNFVEGWSTNVGAIERAPDRGLPSVALPAQFAGPVVFSFQPPGYNAGMFVFGFAALLSIWFWRWDGRRRMHAQVPEANRSA